MEVMLGNMCSQPCAKLLTYRSSCVCGETQVIYTTTNAGGDVWTLSAQNGMIKRKKNVVNNNMLCPIASVTTVQRSNIFRKPLLNSTAFPQHL